MSSTICSTRSRLRRKMVLPVTVTKNNGHDKQLAHTLDLTEVSARLGGLTLVLEPGEIIEVQRGAVKAKFQVFWVGAPGSAMEGQAGVRSVEPHKSIWGINLPPDETDLPANARPLRQPMPPTRETLPESEKRWHTRFECSGGASVRSNASAFPIRGEVKDISRGGVYVETTTPLPVNSEVQIKINVEETPIESAGVVRTSYPLVGMGISLQEISTENQQKLDHVIQLLRIRGSAKGPVVAAAVKPPEQKESLPAAEANSLEAYPLNRLISVCRTVAENVEELRATRKAAELEDLHLAVADLYHKLSPQPKIDLLDFYAVTAPSGEPG